MPKKTKMQASIHRSQNCNEGYLFMKRDNIYKWLITGITMTDIAKKLGVSRSWLFDQFNKFEWLNDLRESAKAERSERVNNTLFQLAIGDYITHAKYTTKTTQKDGDGNSVTSTLIEDKKVEHKQDPNLRAMAIYMRQQAALNNRQETNSKISDTISPDEFEYADVETDDLDGGNDAN